MVMSAIRPPRWAAAAPMRPLPALRRPRSAEPMAASLARRAAHRRRGPGREAFAFDAPRLEERTVLVAGGRTDMQRGIAAAVLREGGRIALLSRTLDGAAPVLPARVDPWACLTLAGDAHDPSLLTDAVLRATDRFGGVDVVVVNARDDADGRDAVAGAFDCVRAAASQLGDGASVIATLSRGTYDDVARLIEETRAWALALRQRSIRVNGIAPRLRALEDGSSQRPADAAASAGWPRTRELARCCVFLASDESVDLTGHVFPAA
jgi:NAD(P)-dependent dehydrogenase (short-subunit alcohol dehydrogenase family)